MKFINLFIVVSFSLLIWAGCTDQKPGTSSEDMKDVTLMTLEPGHFHAGLVQKNAYDQVSNTVYVFAPEGPELSAYQGLVNQYNTRTENPTNWNQIVYSGADYFEKMLSEKPGNVVVLSGNNARKTEYIQKSIQAGLNVLADKPMIINPEGFEILKQTFKDAEQKGVLLYDIMTERFEITTILQKELSRNNDLFGILKEGTPEDPSITKESVHHFFKYVSGNPLKRPAWFFDVSQQGEGVVDVSTHLVDLVFWECFPNQIIDYESGIEVLLGRRWATELTPSQFGRVTGLNSYPEYLEKDITSDSILKVFSNGEIIFKVNGIHAKVSVIWNYQAPEGAKDTHYSIMKGTKANLIIRQGAEQDYLTTLYVEPLAGIDKSEAESALRSALEKLSGNYSGIGLVPSKNGWEILIPDEFKIGHEAHFAQVTQAYLKYLEDGKLPKWEVPNMIAKYFVTSTGYKLSR